MKNIVSHQEFGEAFEDLQSMIDQIAKALHLDFTYIQLETFWPVLNPAPGEIGEYSIYPMIEIKEDMTPDQAEQMGKVLIMASEIMRNFKYFGYHVQGDDPDFDLDTFNLSDYDSAPVPVSEKDLLRELEVWNRLLARRQEVLGLPRTMLQFGLVPVSAISDNSRVELQIEFLDIDFITAEELKKLAPIYVDAFELAKHFRYNGCPIEGAEGTEKMRNFLRQIQKDISENSN